MKSTTLMCMVSGIALLSMGCGGGGHKIQVVPTPLEGTRVNLDQIYQGAGITTVELKENRPYLLSVCAPIPYYCWTGTVNRNSPNRLRVIVPQIGGWNLTVAGVDASGNMVVGQWISIPVNSRWGTEEAWQRLTSALSRATADFEVLDQRSMYLRSAWRRAGGGAMWFQSRIVASVEDPTPDHLVFRLRIESEITDGVQPTVSDRTYQDFIGALADARGRLQ